MYPSSHLLLKIRNHSMLSFVRKTLACLKIVSVLPLDLSSITEFSTHIAYLQPAQHGLIQLNPTSTGVEVVVCGMGGGVHSTTPKYFVPWKRQGADFLLCCSSIPYLLPQFSKSAQNCGLQPQKHFSGLMIFEVPQGYYENLTNTFL